MRPCFKSKYFGIVTDKNNTKWNNTIGLSQVLNMHTTEDNSNSSLVPAGSLQGDATWSTCHIAPTQPVFRLSSKKLGNCVIK